MNVFYLIIVVPIALSLAAVLYQRGGETGRQSVLEVIRLPDPQLDGRCSLEKALASRRSVRLFSRDALSLVEVSQLVWAAQGVTLKSGPPPGWSWGSWQGGKRTAPSAGALYPLELYLLAGNIEGLRPAVYKYKPQTHELLAVEAGDKRRALARAALGQNWMDDVPCVFVIAAVYKRTEVKYRERAPRYVHMEAGHAVENICLQSVALGLGSTMVGAFNDEEVKSLLRMPEEEQPLAIVPVGKPQ